MGDADRGECMLKSSGSVCSGKSLGTCRIGIRRMRRTSCDLRLRFSLHSVLSSMLRLSGIWCTSASMSSFSVFGASCVKLRETERNGEKLYGKGSGMAAISSECSLASERLLADLLSMDMVGDIAGVGGLLMLHLWLRR